MLIKKNYRVRFYLIVILLLFTVSVSGAPTGAAAATATGAEQGGIVKTTLENGLTIVINPNVDNEVVEFQVFAKMGQAYESPQNYGISALLQKVITRGTAGATAQQIDLTLESYGAVLDTDTGLDYGVLSLKCTGEVLPNCLPLMNAIVQEPVFPAAEVEKERQMLIRAISGAGDQGQNRVTDLFLKSFYGDCPYGVAAEQLAQSVAAIGREDLIAWYHRVFTARNMVISIVGKVNAADLIKKLKNVFQKIPSGEALVQNMTPPPAHDRDLETTKIKETEALLMMLGYPAPDLYSSDWPAMTVCNWILGGSGMGSRLFSELREQKSLAYEVDSSYQKLSGPSYIAAFIATAPVNYQAARDGLIAAFQRLTKEKVSDAELSVAKRALRGRFMMAHETNAGRAGIMGRYELFGLGYPYEAQYPLLIERVTADDVQRVAQKYFQYYTLSVVSPEQIK